MISWSRTGLWLAVSQKRAKKSWGTFCSVCPSGKSNLLYGERSAEIRSMLQMLFRKQKILLSWMRLQIYVKEPGKCRCCKNSIARHAHRKKVFVCRIGYGGSAFRKMWKRLQKFQTILIMIFKFWKSVMSVNDKQKLIIVEKIKEHFKRNLKGKKFALWGLSFKRILTTSAKRLRCTLLKNYWKKEPFYYRFRSRSDEYVKKKNRK